MSEIFSKTSEIFSKLSEIFEKTSEIILEMSEFFIDSLEKPQKTQGGVKEEGEGTKQKGTSPPSCEKVPMRK